VKEKMPIMQANIEQVDALCTMDKEVVGDFSRKEMK